MKIKQIPTIVSAKNGSLVPVIDGTYLHSVYNPEKESVTMIERYLPQIKTKPNILMLGLGFGYHINYTQSLLKRFHKKFNIVIIEPNVDLAEIVLSKKMICTDGVSLFAGHDISSLYSNKKLIEFLSSHPLLISHTPSFNLHKEYFTRFLSFRASHYISDIAKIISNISFKNYLQSYSDNHLLTEVFSNIENKNSLEDEEKILLIYKNLYMKEKMAGETNA